MRTQISKWGNSLGVRIPKACVEELGLAEGAQVDVRVSGGKLVLAPAQQDYTLEELVDGITPKNRHTETDWGIPRGKEIW